MQPPEKTDLTQTSTQVDTLQAQVQLLVVLQAPRKGLIEQRLRYL